jgi:citrate/tricarballylate utilization protein
MGPQALGKQRASSGQKENRMSVEATASLRAGEVTVAAPLHGDADQKPMDRAFIILLFLTSITGLGLLVWRETGAMPLLLAIHLGVVMALFLTLPYGKFAHGIYRSAALLKWSIEKRQPSKLSLGSD